MSLYVLVHTLLCAPCDPWLSTVQASNNVLMLETLPPMLDIQHPLLLRLNIIHCLPYVAGAVDWNSQRHKESLAQQWIRGSYSLGVPISTPRFFSLKVEFGRVHSNHVLDLSTVGILYCMIVLYYASQFRMKLVAPLSNTPITFFQSQDFLQFQACFTSLL